jgi:predicted transcriptional regulator
MALKDVIRWFEESSWARKVFEELVKGRAGAIELQRSLGLEWWLLRHILEGLMEEGVVAAEEDGFTLTDKGRELKEILDTLSRVKGI